MDAKKDSAIPSRSMPLLVLTGALVLMNVAAAVYFLVGLGGKDDGSSQKPSAGERGLAFDPAAYAGSASCRDCHKEAYEQWQNSHHALAERTLNPTLDRPAFDPPRTFKHGTQVSDVRIAPNGRFEVVTMSLKGERNVFAPERVIGVEPLRQMLVTAPGGRYQVTEVAYDPRSNDWFNVYGEEDRQAGEWGHWTGRGMNWNMMCAYCHNTALRKNYRADTDTYATTLVEMGVGCEGCHGPMADHVKWQRPRPQPAKGDPTLRRWSKAQWVDACGPCHARRSDLTGAFRVGDSLLDHYGLVIPDETDIYYPDGQVRDEDYEYAAFLGSRMRFSDVWCMDCHNPHTAKNPLPKDDLCLRCHAGPIAPAPKIEAATHSFHKRGEPGDHCVDCHMPLTVYMARHWRRDHGFTVPDPLLTKEHGIPNACNRCHKDKTVEWSIEYIDKWYGPRMERPARARTRILAKAREGHHEAVAGLRKLAREEALPYWRAVPTLLLRRWNHEADVLTTILERAGDTNALVRAMAARALEPLAGEGNREVRQALNQLLTDPIRAVRVEAAWALRRTLDTNSAAGQDLLHYLSENSDQPSGLLQMGVFTLDRGDNRAALPLLQRAVTWDAYSAPLRGALAVSLSLAGRREEAVTELEAAVRLAPRDPEPRYRLGLAYNEVNRLNEAVAALEEAVKLDAQFTPAWYNLGLGYAAQEKLERAAEALAKAEALEPASSQIPYARATVLARMGREIEAAAAARKALQIQPGHAEAAALLQALLK